MAASAVATAPKSMKAAVGMGSRLTSKKPVKGKEKEDAGKEVNSWKVSVEILEGKDCIDKAAIPFEGMTIPEWPIRSEAEDPFVKESQLQAVASQIVEDKMQRTELNGKTIDNSAVS